MTHSREIDEPGIFIPGRVFWATLQHPCFGRRTHWTVLEDLHIGKRVRVEFAGENQYGVPYFRLVGARWDSGCIPLHYLSKMGVRR